jgi:benzylsuccinate CoA-transferase BbsF subunit
MVNERNRNKLGIALDLVHPEGKALFKRLVAISDVVLENFSVRVMRKLELDYPVLKEINPQLVMISIASQGLTGPERDYVSIDPILQALSGLALLSGRAGEPPGIAAMLVDPLAAVHAAGCVLAGLLARQRTGEGCHIDFSQREAAALVIGSALMDYTMHGRVATPQGNDNSAVILQGCFRCRGERGWVTIAIATEEEWQRLCCALEHPAWTREPRFADPGQRRQHQVELRGHLEAWTQAHTKYEVTKRLQEAGVPAGPVLSARELFEDVHLEQRGFFEVSTHPEAGTHPYCGRPMRFSKTPLGTRRPAPRFGEHNAYVFGELLGLSAEEIAHLTDEGVIATQPLVPMGE